jgi:serine/threonine-protein kinase
MAVAGTALLLALAVAVLVLLPRMRNVEVPKVVGMESAFVAEQQLVKHGLEFDPNQKTMVDEDAVPGSVLAQTPQAGEQLRKGSAVTVLIAVGSGEVTVPKVVGATLEDADSRLRQRQLTLGQVSPQNARLDAKIARQMPRAGEKVKAGTAVSVFLPAQ